jgi:hypothetical protein
MAENKRAKRGAHDPLPTLKNPPGCHQVQMPYQNASLVQAVNTAPTPECKAGTGLDPPVCCSAAMACKTAS